MKRLAVGLVALGLMVTAPGCCNPFFFNETDPTFAEPECDWTSGPFGWVGKARKLHMATPSVHWGRAGDSPACAPTPCVLGPDGRPISPVPGQPSMGAVAYPYYTNRGPRDFFLANPPDIGP